MSLRESFKASSTISLKRELVYRYIGIPRVWLDVWETCVTE